MKEILSNIKVFEKETEYDDGGRSYICYQKGDIGILLDSEQETDENMDIIKQLFDIKKEIGFEYCTALKLEFKQDALIRRNLYHNFSLKNKLEWSLFGYFDEEGDTSGFMDGFWGHDFTQERINNAQKRMPDVTIHKIVWRNYEMGKYMEWQKDPNEFAVFYVKKQFRDKYGKTIKKEDALPHLKERPHIFSMAAGKWNHINVTEEIPEEMEKTRLDSFRRTGRKSMRGYGCEALVLTTQREFDDGLDPKDFWTCKHAGILDFAEFFNVITKEKRLITIHESLEAVPSIKKLLHLKKKFPKSLRHSTWNELKQQKKELCRFILGHSPKIILSNGVIFRSTYFTVGTSKYWATSYDDDSTIIRLQFRNAEKDCERIPLSHDTYREFKFHSQDDEIDDIIAKMEEKTSFIDEKYGNTFKINDKKCTIKEIEPWGDTFIFCIGVEGFHVNLDVGGNTFSEMKEKLHGDHKAIFEEEEGKTEDLLSKYFSAFTRVLSNINHPEINTDYLKQRFEEFKRSLPKRSTIRIKEGESIYDDFSFVLNGIEGRFKAELVDYDYYKVIVDVKCGSFNLNFNYEN